LVSLRKDKRLPELNKVIAVQLYTPARFAIVIAILLLPLLTACGGGDTTSSLPVSASPSVQASKMIKIGVDLPLSGQSASSGIPTRNGIQLAVEQANRGGEVIPGYKLEMYALDDAINGVHNPQQGAANAQSFIADEAVVAIVGPFNTNVARAMMPPLNRANLAMISPSNANEALTKPQYGQTGVLRPSGTVTYFRVSTPDDVRAPIAADYSVDKLGFKTVYVLDDQEAYGKGVADNFARRFSVRRGAAAMLGRDGVPSGTSDFRSILTTIAARKPDFVYYGGTSSNGLGLFRKQMKDIMPNVPMMGADGIVEQQFLDDAGNNANGAYATVGTSNVASNPAGQKFIADYKARFGAEPGAYSANSWEATNIIIAAIKAGSARWSRDYQTNREIVRANIQATRSYQGITGIVGFDANGDTTNLNLGIYMVKDSKWQLIEQMHFNATGRLCQEARAAVGRNSSRPASRSREQSRRCNGRRRPACPPHPRFSPPTPGCCARCAAGWQLP
jgi:branched-chain amino acid transport system substrate-binding protein